MATSELNVGPRRAGSTRLLDLRDERPHPPAGDDPYWTETVWFAALAPSDHLGCWVYLHLRPNLGISAAGIWIWDDTALVPWEMPYTNFRWHLPMPTWDDDGIIIGDDIEVRCIEPFRHHHVIHHGFNGVRLDLDFEGIDEASSVGVDEQVGHFDQAQWVTGEIVVDGRIIAVDGPGMRDRSWSPRTDEPRNDRRYYTFGMSRDAAFHAYAQHLVDDETVPIAGTVTLGEMTAEVVDVRREVLSRRDGPPLRLRMTIFDSLGRSLTADGTTLSAIALTSWPPFITWVSLVRWNIDGIGEIWGEDDETWSLGAQTQRRRRGMVADPFLLGHPAEDTATVNGS